MLPLEALTAAEARQLAGVVFDLDDTLLDHGSLGEAAYRALFQLRDAGLLLVACTGRPAGWGQVIQRQWPVDATVVENGATAFVRVPSSHAGGRIEAVDALDRAARRDRRAALVELAADLVARFPNTALADDNDARVTDVTLDIGEHRSVPTAEVNAMRAIARERGVRTTASSVHLHLTLETDDKASGTLRVLVGRFGEDATAARRRFAYVGDSGNDAAPFAAFSVSIGVANVASHLRALTVPPRYVSASAMGRGFAEVSARLVKLRGFT